MNIVFSRVNWLTKVSIPMFLVSTLAMVACRLAQYYLALPAWVNAVQEALVGVAMASLSGVLVGEVAAPSDSRRWRPGRPGQIINLVLAVALLAVGLILLAGVIAGLMK